MTPSPSVVAAATTLAGWAHERRRSWSDLPLEAPRQAVARVETVVEAVVETVIEPTVEPTVESAPEPIFQAAEEAAAVLARPSAGAMAAAGLSACATAAGGILGAAVAWLQTLAEPAARWLLRGAAVASMLSVVMFAGMNRGPLLAQWDRARAMVVAAASRSETPPAQPAAPPSGTGRLTVAVPDGTAQVLIDGTSRGDAPLTVDLPAGAHRVLLRSPKGSVERAVRIRAGESSEVTEAIFPGWIALTTPIDLSMSEGGQALKRDERGWAILAPGPHDILLDNRTLGVHEVRRVVVTPGDTTRLSFVPRASTISLTTNEVADVWIDGASFGQAPLVDQPIAIGLHDVRVRSALHERWVRVRATVQPVQVNVDMTAR